MTLPIQHIQQRTLVKQQEVGRQLQKAADRAQRALSDAQRIIKRRTTDLRQLKRDAKDLAQQLSTALTRVAFHNEYIVQLQSDCDLLNAPIKRRSGSLQDMVEAGTATRLEEIEYYIERCAQYNEQFNPRDFDMTPEEIEEYCNKGETNNG